MTSMGDESVRVLLVAPTMTCWGLQQLLLQSSAPRFETVGTAQQLDRASQAALQSLPDVIVVDVDVDDHDTGCRLGDFVAGTSVPVIALTSAAPMPWLEEAIAKGLRGVVHRRDEPGSLLKAIEKVTAGELWLDRGTASRVFMHMVRERAADSADPERAKIATLTVRERQAIAMLVSDAAATGKVIARRLCISEHTLRNHLSSIYSKLHVSNRVELYAYATRHRLDKPT